MFSLNTTLLNLKYRLWKQFRYVNNELDSLICQSIENGDCKVLWDKISIIALENLEATLNFRELLQDDMNGEACLFVHGSTAIGAGQIAPNLEFRFIGRDQDPELSVNVVPACRDDVDMFLIVKDPVSWEKKVYSAFKKMSGNRIDITLNLISKQEALQELSDQDAPALRRILLFKHPKCLLGSAEFQSLKKMARSNTSQYDLAHEMDFRLLMCVSGVMHANGIKNYVFKTSDLLMLFPTLYLAQRNGLRIGFPRHRLKLKNDKELYAN